MMQRAWQLRVGVALAVFALFVVSLMGGILYRRNRPRPPRPQLMAAFLDVGEGDCTLIRVPGGHAILVDTGPAAAGPAVVQTLRDQGIGSLDLLVLASPLPGSIGSVTSIMESGVHVAQAWVCPLRDHTETTGAALLALRQHHVPTRTVQADDALALAGARLTVLWPPARSAGRGHKALICRVDYGKTGIVLAGPADTDEASYLVAGAAQALDCDVLQIPAGGADGATTPEMLRRATPSVAVISCSPSAPPGPLTLHRLEAAGASVWRTDIQGAVTVFTDGYAPPSVTGTQLTKK